MADGSNFCGSCGATRDGALTTGSPLAPPPPSSGTATFAPPSYARAPLYAPAAPTNGFAIAALICGLVGACGVGSILAIVFGNVSRRQIIERGERGDGMALAGIILGWIGVAGIAIWIVVIVVAAAQSGSNY